LTLGHRKRQVGENHRSLMAARKVGARARAPSRKNLSGSVRKVPRHGLRFASELAPSRKGATETLEKAAALKGRVRGKNGASRKSTMALRRLPGRVGRLG